MQGGNEQTGMFTMAYTPIVFCLVLSYYFLITLRQHTPKHLFNDGCSIYSVLVGVWRVFLAIPVWVM